MIARSIVQRYAVIACMASALAGCATAEPPAGDAAPSCDLICQIIRLFTPEPPPAPPPDPALPPAATPVKSKRARSSPRRASSNRTPDTRPVADAAAPLPPDDEPNGLSGLRPTANPMLVPIPGSPGITPPWFEPPLAE